MSHPTLRQRFPSPATALRVAAVTSTLPSGAGGSSRARDAAGTQGGAGIGVIGGVLSGLFGIGGGIIAVPLMSSLFAVSDLVAKGTSLLVAVPTSAVDTLSNRRSGLTDVRVGLVLGAAAAAASIPAVSLSLALPARLSGQLFAGLLILVAVQMSVSTSRDRTTR